MILSAADSSPSDAVHTMRAIAGLLPVGPEGHFMIVLS